MILQLKDLALQLSKDNSINLGCMVDTNVLFAASYPPDIFNEWAEEVFALLHKLEIPIYTNINVRSEFLDLHRKVLIPEGLLTLLHDFSGSLGTEIETQLRLLKARFQKSLDENKAFKLQDAEIKKYRKLLSAIQLNSENAWIVFCENYLHPYIEKIWDDTVETLKVKFLGTRQMDNQEIFDGHPSWADLVEIIGKSGIGTADAMIINLFQKSKLTLMVTADGDIRDTVMTQFAQNRYILAPND